MVFNKLMKSCTTEPFFLLNFVLVIKHHQLKNTFCQIDKDGANFHIGHSGVTEWFQHQFGALTPDRDRLSHHPPILGSLPKYYYSGKTHKLKTAVG
jgi:hypothetical protein